ncbi:heavy metal translocating P-type ATPase [Mesorhizobium zhangyense]|uniref:heavy metal translocating P-type ATPase n=1 Tax=Mesorhizobium zhangyense TaxID=1776730 RepID=UPI001FE59971|nr:heavy metal translocating P-type ATPase [Mesorhizobium zhangyense]
MPEAPTAAQKASGRSFRVFGMDCAEEVATLKTAVGPVVGGDRHLAFDVLNGRMTILDSAGSVRDAAIVSAVAATGLKAEPWQEGAPPAKDARLGEQKLFTALSGIFLLAGFAVHVVTSPGQSFLEIMGFHHPAGAPLAEQAALLLSVITGARFVAIKAWYSLKRLSPDMNLLMMVAVAGALIIGEWFEAATVAFLFALSLLLESWSVGRARNAVSTLLDLAPPVVRVKDANGEREMKAAEVAVGSRFIVRGGDRIALDGRIVSGASAVNQAPITGESIPVSKEIGDEVFAGTINGDGLLEVESAKAATDTTLARIIRMVSDAHSRRAAVEQWVERFARVYTPAVMVLALLVFVVPPLLFGGTWEAWFYNALVLLVIACPCALVISTPVSIVAALASAARNGVLIKGGTFIELPAKLTALAMDKTGTLTKGEPQVTRVIPLSGHSEEELLQRAGALEARSSHPLAQAVTQYLASKKVKAVAAEDVKLLPGKGVQGSFNGKTYWLGSWRYVVERGQADDAVAAQIAELENAGATTVIIGNDEHLCGIIALADTIRPEAKAILSALHAEGVKEVVMLTGDNRAAANAVAQAVGIDTVRAELLPEQKVEAIDALTKRHAMVAMIGDGVNDAPAMARAHFGIAMGAIGSDAAIETADIALMTDDLSKVPWLIRHSRRAMSIIRQNIVFALGVKALFVALTALGIATMWGAIAADVGASLLVVGNALRLLNAGDKRMQG